MYKNFFFLCFLLSVFGFAEQKLKIEMYTESLCPNCIEFLTLNFQKVFRTKNISLIAEFSIFPFGNARQSYLENKWTFKCQHGSQECYGNLLQNCALNKTNFEIGTNYIICLEENIHSFKKNFEKTGEHCAKLQNLNFEEFKECMNGELGNEIMHSVAEKTNSLNPTHTYVPWVVVNGVHDDEIEDQILDNMLNYICNNYNGDVLIEDCQHNKNFLKK